MLRHPAQTTIGNVHVTKLLAAQRQLLEAVRMFFAGRDQLAVHTVASAAYGIIKDLKAERGRDEAGDYYLTMTFYAVRSYRRGSLPPRLTEDPDFMGWVRKMAKRLPITASTQYHEVKVHLDPQTTREFWSRSNRASNFLKHADRDAGDSLSLDDLDNLYLLTLAFGSYRNLVQGAVDPESEGLVLWVYFNTVTGQKDNLPKPLQRLAASLEKLPDEQRLAFCCNWLESMDDDNS